MTEESKPKEEPKRETQLPYQMQPYPVRYNQYPYKKLYRSTRDKWIAGVCGGLAEYLNKDPVIIRLLWIVLTLLSFGVGVIAYLAFWVIVDKYPSYYPLPVHHPPQLTDQSLSGKRAVHYHYYFKSPP